MGRGSRPLGLDLCRYSGLGESQFGPCAHREPNSRNLVHGLFGNGD